MFGFRFSLAQLAMAMVVVGLGCAAMVSANAFVASLALTVFFLGNLLALTGSFATAGAPRAFWIGMAIFGWAYWWQHEPTLLRDDASNRYRYGGYSYYLSGLSSYSSDASPATPRLASEWILDRLFRLTSQAPKLGDKVVARWMGGSFFPGTVKEFVESGDLVVQWDDGSAPSNVAPRDVHVEGGGFHVTGHSVFGVFFGLFGGMLGLAFFGPKPEGDSAAPLAAATTASPSAAPPPATGQ